MRPIRRCPGADQPSWSIFRADWIPLRRRPMAKGVVCAEVEDLNKWEAGFRTHADLFRQMAVRRMEYATGEGNQIVVFGETHDLDAYMKVFTSPATAEAMAVDGVKRETVKM